MRGLVLALAMVVASAGCTDSHERDDDGGTPLPAIVVNELQPLGDQFAELVNAGDGPAALGGMTITLGEDPERDAVLPAELTLSPGEHFVIAIGVGARASAGIVADAGACRRRPRCTEMAASLDAEVGDRLTLRSRAGERVAEASFEPSDLFDASYSWSRIPDVTGDFARGASSPGHPNTE